jgi:hypothetical protein
MKREESTYKRGAQACANEKKGKKVVDRTQDMPNKCVMDEVDHNGVFAIHVDEM